MQYKDLFDVGKGLNALKDMEIKQGDAKLFLNLHKINKAIESGQDEFFKAKAEAFEKMDSGDEGTRLKIIEELLREECEEIPHKLSYVDLERFSGITLEIISNLEPILSE